MSDLDEALDRADEAADTEGEVALYELGVDVGEELEREILLYVKEEIEVIENARSEREEKWNVWRRHREGRPEREVVDFPWEGASNLVPPVASSNTGGVYAHVRRAFLKRRPLWTVEDYNSGRGRESVAFTDFMNLFAESPSRANVRPVLKKALYESISLGDQFVEVPWVERRLRFDRPSPTGGIEKVDRIVYSGPTFLAHRIENVYARPEIDNLQETPIIAIRQQGYTLGMLRSLERDGFFKNVDLVEEAQSAIPDDNLEAGLAREGLEVADSPNTAVFDIWKSWVFYDIDGDGVPEDVILWYHDETETVLRVELNDFGFRLITDLRYFPIMYSLYSQGVGAMAEHTQEEITTLHNMRINSIHISSLQMLVTRPGTSLGKRATFRPLKNITADNPRDDVQVLTFPDVSSSTLTAEIQAKRYLDMHTGVSEAMLGMPDQTAKSGTSPSLQMFLAEQGNAILETAIESLSEGLSELGMFFMLQLVKNSDSILPYLDELVSEERRDEVREILEMSIEDVPLRVGMSVKTTEVQKSEDAKRQNLMAMNQLYSMYGQEMMQYIQVLSSPEVPQEIKEFAMRVYLGKTKVMEETLELFGTDNTEDFVPYVRDVEMMLEMVDSQKRAITEQLSMQLRNGGGVNGQMAGAAGATGAVSGTVPDGGGTAGGPNAAAPPPEAGGPAAGTMPAGPAPGPQEGGGIPTAG